MKSIRLNLILISFLSMMAPTVAATDEIEYLFFEFKPRMSYATGQVEGVVASKAMAAFKLAELNVTVTSDLPAKRVLSLLQADVENRCSVGWFKTKEREKIYRYSDAIFTDPKHLILTTRANKPQFDSYTSIVDLLSDKNQILGRTTALSFGQPLDDLLTQAETPFYEVQSYQEMFLMLATGRFGYVVTDPFELDVILEHADLAPADFVSYEFTDIPPGEDRYIVCTKTTPASVMDRINAAIAELSN